MTATRTDLGYRQRGLLDTDLLNSTHIGGIGMSRSLLTFEILCSSGVGNFVICDPQEISHDNMGQTAFRIDEIGSTKVEAIKNRLTCLSPFVKVKLHQRKAEEIPDLREIVRTLDVLKIGIDDPAAQFSLTDLAQEVGTPAIVAGTTGDNSQHFIACVTPDGPPLRALLPTAWASIQAGYRPPEFFPSCRLNAETVSVQAARVVLALLHHQGGSDLPIARIGKALTTQPLIIGSNGLHEPSGFLTPTRLLGSPPL